jgi:hypothetical protein
MQLKLIRNKDEWEQLLKERWPTQVVISQPTEYPCMLYVAYVSTLTVKCDFVYIKDIQPLVDYV